MKHNENKLLVGIKINEKLRYHLDSSKTSVKPFFEKDDPHFLQIIEISSEEYLSKITRSGASLEDLANMCMNLKTMLKMICPEFVITDNAIKIHAFIQSSDNQGE